MNDISSITRDQVAIVATVPAIPPIGGEIASIITCFELGIVPGKVETDGQGRGWVRGIGPVLIAEAEARLAQIEPLLAPAEPTEMVAWLCHLRHSVRNAPEGWQAIQAKARAIWEDCGVLPRGVWCEETRRLWRQQPARGDYMPGAFWPLPGELGPILQGYAGRLRREERACRRIVAAGAGPGGEEQPPAGEEERARVAEMMQAHRDEMAVRSGEPDGWARAVGAVVRQVAEAREEAAA